MIKDKKIIAENLHKNACGYGMSQEDILKCLEGVPDGLIHRFLYTLSRIAEKSGFQAIITSSEDYEYINESENV